MPLILYQRVLGVKRKYRYRMVNRSLIRLVWTEIEVVCKLGIAGERNYSIYTL